MQVKNITQRFQAFVRDLQETFWGDFQGQMQQRLKEVLEKDAELQMASGSGRAHSTGAGDTGILSEQMMKEVENSVPGESSSQRLFL